MYTNTYTGCQDDWCHETKTYVSKSVKERDIRFTPLKNKLTKLSLTINLIRTNTITAGCMTNTRMISRLCRNVLKHVAGYRGHSVPYVGSQLLRIFAFDLTDDVLSLSP